MGIDVSRVTKKLMAMMRNKNRKKILKFENSELDK
jgi:hypothetical protein